EIAAAATRHEDLLARTVGPLDDPHATPAAARGHRTHEPGRAGPDDQHVAWNRHRDRIARAMASQARPRGLRPPRRNAAEGPASRPAARSRMARCTHSQVIRRILASPPP